MQGFGLRNGKEMATNMLLAMLSGLLQASIPSLLCTISVSLRRIAPQR